MGKERRGKLRRGEEYYDPKGCVREGEEREERGSEIRGRADKELGRETDRKEG